MPNRILRDAALDSDRLAAVTELAEVLFYRLLMLADDFGRFDGRASVIRARAFALRQDQVSEDQVIHRLQELCKVGLIHRYEVLQKPYIFIPRFAQRQRAEKSKFPDPPDISQSNDGQTTDGGQASAAVVVVVGVDEGDDRGRSRSTPPTPPSRGDVDKSRSKPRGNGSSSEPHCAYCEKPATSTVNGRRSCEEHFLNAMDNEKPGATAATHARATLPTSTPKPQPELDPDQGFPVRRKSKFEDVETEQKPAEQSPSGT